MLTQGTISIDSLRQSESDYRNESAPTYKKATYKSCMNYINNETTIIIEYRGKTLLTCIFTGQLQPPAIKEYAIEMCELLIEKGVFDSW